MRPVVPGIPSQFTGGESNTESLLDFSNPEEAASFFKIARERLLTVNNWEEVAEMPSADFHLCDEFGREVNRTAKEGDHFRIEIPGPGNQEGDGADWVKVKSIEERYSVEEDHIIMTVSPASNPLKKSDETTHFFKEEATSSFVVQRDGSKVMAAVYGRNEKPNTEQHNLIDKIRNSIVATAAITAFSKIQWKGLVEGLLKRA